MPRRGDRLLAAGGLTLGAAFALAASAEAAPITVTNLNSSGPGSLADALSASNADPTVGSILFESGLRGTINLSAPLEMSRPVDVEGPGSDQITINGGDAHQIFYIYFPPYYGDPVAISGLTLTHGLADFGGGIWNRSSRLTLTDMVVSHSRAFVDGGAIDSSGAFGTKLTLRSSTLSGNTSAVRGGGLDVECVLEISDSTISGNTVAADGGGIGMVEYGQAKIQNSTITGNGAGGDGGGIATYAGAPGANLEVQSSTIAGNSAASDHTGGGISLDAAPSPLPSPSSPKLENTIVSGNTAGQGPDLYSYGPPIDAAFSLIKDPFGATINTTVAGSVIIGQDPQLGPLQANGGPAATMAPGPISPAIDNGSAFGLGVDQRGSARPIDYPGVPASSATGADGSDIGAVELGLPLPVEPGGGPGGGPSNAFSFGKVKHDRRRGTVTLGVHVPGPGTLALGGKRVVSQRSAGRRNLFGRSSRAVAGAGVVALLVKAKGVAKRRLDRHGSAKVKAVVTFTPTAGTPSTATRKIRLVKKIR
jgi:Right handed beta helix region